MNNLLIDETEIISTKIIPEINNIIKQISCGNEHYMVLLNNGEILCWGNNDYGQCNIPQEIINIVDIVAGYNHSIVLLQDKTIIKWGKEGRIDLSFADLLSNFDIVYNDDINILKILCGIDITLILLSNNKLLCLRYFNNAIIYHNIPVIGDNYNIIDVSCNESNDFIYDDIANFISILYYNENIYKINYYKLEFIEDEGFENIQDNTIDILEEKEFIHHGKFLFLNKDEEDKEISVDKTETDYGNKFFYSYVNKPKLGENDKITKIYCGKEINIIVINDNIIKCFGIIKYQQNYYNFNASDIYTCSGKIENIAILNKTIFLLIGGKIKILTVKSLDEIGEYNYYGDDEDYYRHNEAILYNTYDLELEHTYLDYRENKKYSEKRNIIFNDRFIEECIVKKITGNEKYLLLLLNNNKIIYISNDNSPLIIPNPISFTGYQEFSTFKEYYNHLRNTIISPETLLKIKEEKESKLIAEEKYRQDEIKKQEEQLKKREEDLKRRKDDIKEHVERHRIFIEKEKKENDDDPNGKKRKKERELEKKKTLDEIKIMESRKIKLLEDKSELERQKNIFIIFNDKIISIINEIVDNEIKKVINNTDYQKIGKDWVKKKERFNKHKENICIGLKKLLYITIENDYTKQFNIIENYINGVEGIKSIYCNNIKNDCSDKDTVNTIEIINKINNKIKETFIKHYKEDELIHHYKLFIPKYIKNISEKLTEEEYIDNEILKNNTDMINNYDKIKRLGIEIEKFKNMNSACTISGGNKNDLEYKEKYLKYKQKYLELKKQKK